MSALTLGVQARHPSHGLGEVVTLVYAFGTREPITALLAIPCRAGTRKVPVRAKDLTPVGPQP